MLVASYFAAFGANPARYVRRYGLITHGTSQQPTTFHQEIGPTLIPMSSVLIRSGKPGQSAYVNQIDLIHLPPPFNTKGSVAVGPVNVRASQQPPSYRVTATSMPFVRHEVRHPEGVRQPDRETPSETLYKPSAFLTPPARMGSGRAIHNVGPARKLRLCLCS